MKKITVSIDRNKVIASDDNVSILKELSKILRTASKADESKTLSVRTRKKCLALEYKGCTFYLVRNIQELKEEQASKNSYSQSKSGSSLSGPNGTIRHSSK
jgi:hypothetical protein